MLGWQSMCVDPFPPCSSLLPLPPVLSQVQAQMAAEEEESLRLSAQQGGSASGGYESSGQREKGDLTPVTMADYAVQALVAMGASLRSRE